MPSKELKKNYKIVVDNFGKQIKIPEDWSLLNLGKFAHEVKKKNSENKKLPVLSITKYDGFVDSLKYFKKRVFSKSLSNYKIVEKGYFAYSPIHLDEGSIALLMEFQEGIVSPMYTIFKTDEKIDPKFLLLLMKTELYIQKYSFLGQGSIKRRTAVTFERLSRLSIHIPPISQQQEIVKILTNVENNIILSEKIISHLEKLNQGMLEKLLINGIGNKKFKNIGWYDSTEIKIPETWRLFKLKQLIYDVVGGTPLKPKDFANEGIPVLHKGDIKPDNVIEIGTTNPFCTREFAKKYKKHIIDNTYTVVTLRDLDPEGPAIGLMANCNDEYLLAQGAYGFHVDAKLIDSNFLVLISNSAFYRKYVQKFSVGATQIHIRTPIFLNLEFWIPPLNEQKNISLIMSGINSRVKHEKNRYSKLKLLKCAIQSRLVMGEITLD